MTPTGQVVFFCKLLINGFSHDTKISCIRLFWAGAKNISLIFAMRRPFKYDPLSPESKTQASFSAKILREFSETFAEEFC